MFTILWDDDSATTLLRFETIEKLNEWLDSVLEMAVPDDDEVLVKNCCGEPADGLDRLTVYQDEGYEQCGKITLFKNDIEIRPFEAAS